MRATRTFFTFILCLIGYFGYSQYNQSLHKMLGKVLDIHTKQPIKASIHFTCLNNDGYLGFMKNDSMDGKYELNLVMNQKYCVEISSPNYITIVDTISLQKMIQKNYLLNPLYPFEILNFSTGKDNLIQNSESALQKTIQIMRQFPDFQVQLEGHSDYIGSSQLNLELSKRRAERIRDELIRAGISPKRIKVKAYGGTKPLIHSHEIEQRNINQRVEIRFLN